MVAVFHRVGRTPGAPAALSPRREAEAPGSSLACHSRQRVRSQTSTVLQESSKPVDPKMPRDNEGWKTAWDIIVILTALSFAVWLLLPLIF